MLSSLRSGSKKKQVRGGLLTKLLAAGLSACILPAYAADKPDPADTFKIKLSETLSYDDNLFRLPDGATPQSGGRSSLIRTDTVGFAWDKTYSLQGVHLEANVDRHHYSDHEFLDFTGTNGMFAWNWAFTPHLTGTLSAERKQALTSFTDYSNQNTRNLRTSQSRVASLDYEFLGSLHLLAAAINYSSVSEDNTQPLEDSFKSHGLQAGMKYVFPSKSYLSYVARNENGTYPGQTLVPATMSDSEFHQRSHELQAAWVVTGKTTLTGRLTNTERSHPNISQRDYSGTAGRFDLDWKATAKTSITATIGRDFTVYQTTYSNYISTDTISISPAWQMTAKTALRGQLSRSSRDYLGEPFGPVEMRKDHITSARIELDWEAARSAAVIAALQHDKRDSNYSGLDFTDTTATLQLRLSF